MELERLWRSVDRVAGGRRAAYRIGEASRAEPAVQRSFTILAALLGLLFLVGGGAVGEAYEVSSTGGRISLLIWWRLLVIFAIASTLFYFWWRARLGWWWAFSRLKLFSIVFPIVAGSTSLIPGLYPDWMVIEQLTFSGVLLVVFWVLTRPHLSAAYAKPPDASASG